jgi:hypothetical protein
MQDKQREQRRQKRLEKRKKQRQNVSRPGVGGPAQGIDPLKGKTWPVGECYVSENSDEPGATVEVVLSRTREDGTSVLAVFELDRSGPGLVSAKALGGLRSEHITGECARLSERTGRAMIGCSGGLAASLVQDAREHGTNSDPSGASAALQLLQDIPRIELPTAFGPAETPPVPAAGESQPGFWAGLRKRLIG